MEINNILAEYTSTKSPKTLYHYTDQAGLLGILESGELWGTEIQYMNDHSELVMALDIIADEIRKRGEDQKQEPRNKRHALIHKVTSLIHNLPIYVISFSKEQDSLAMWRGYTKTGNSAYAIGFDFPHLLNRVGEDNLFMAECVYDEKRQREIIKALIDYSESCNVDQFRDPKSFISLFSRLASIMKNKAFKDESEWRIIADTLFYDENPPTSSYRAGRSMIIPFHRMKMTNDNKLRSCINEIIVGPCPNMEHSVKSIESFAGKKSDWKIKVIPSSIPFRNW